MLKFFMTIFFSSPILTLFSQKTITNLISKDYILSDFKFDKESLFVICRGTKTKSGLIAKNFNLSDTNATHVGIAFERFNNLRIFNVTNEKYKDENALRVDSLASFIENEDIYYLSIWKINTSPEEFKLAMTFIDRELEKKIQFDYNFRISDDDTLYCSEFCIRLLKFINSEKFKFNPQKKELKSLLLEAVLKRKILNYFPVDFFTLNKNFSHIASFYLKK